MRQGRSKWLVGFYSVRDRVTPNVTVGGAESGRIAGAGSRIAFTPVDSFGLSLLERDV